ncbi:MAG: M48 family metallopeptidase [Vampirovibrionales bacterium]|nr:M48 family metallopeptidase [Vampirovibrionales bacterium]
MLETIIEEVNDIKRASGVLRHGAIHISVPKRWPKREKHDAIDYLKRILFQKAQKEAKLLAKLDQWMSTPEGQAQLITIDTEQALNSYVRQLNLETLRVPLAKVRIGQAKFSRLAQMNIETRTMSVSKYCLKGVPEPALRYLIVHELAHLIEANHSKRFWRLVAQFVPDYKQQSDIIKAFHKRCVDLQSVPDIPNRLVQMVQTLATLPEPAASKQPALPKVFQELPPARQREDTKETTGLPAHLKRWWQLKLF